MREKIKKMIKTEYSKKSLALFLGGMLASHYHWGSLSYGSLNIFKKMI